MRNLKKIIVSFMVFVFLFLASVQKSNAQAAIFVFLFGEKVASESFYLSLKIGGHLSYLTNLDEEAKYIFGMQFGMLAHVVLSDDFIIVPEIAFLSQKGAKNLRYTTTDNMHLDSLLTGITHYEILTNYMDVPIIFRYYFIEQFYAGGGPYFSWLMYAKNHYINTPSGYDELDITRSVKYDYNKFDYGLSVEVGWAPKRVGRRDAMTLSLRYSYGFANVLKNHPNGLISNSVIEGAVSFPFQIEQDEEKPEKKD